MDLPAGGVETAQRLVDECKARVAEQVARIAELKRNRCATAEAQVLLATLENLARHKARAARWRPVGL